MRFSKFSVFLIAAAILFCSLNGEGAIVLTVEKPNVEFSSELDLRNGGTENFDSLTNDNYLTKTLTLTLGRVEVKLTNMEIQGTVVLGGPGQKHVHAEATTNSSALSMKFTQPVSRCGFLLKPRAVGLLCALLV